MGNECKHERTEFIRNVYEINGTLFHTKIVEEKCLDCLTEEQPTLLRKHYRDGSQTGIIYAVNKVDKAKCKHEYFDVDSKTERQKSNSSLFGLINDNYIEAVGTCKRCESKFLVSCSEDRGTWNIIK